MALHESLTPDEPARAGPATAPPHASPAETVVKRLGSDAATCLSVEEASARAARFGPNARPGPEGPSYAAIAVRQFLDPLVGLLIAAIVVSAAIGHGLEAAAIGVIVLLNGVLGFVQEARAERAVQALHERVPRLAAAVRGGREVQLPAEDVVTGDVLVLREGDHVAADGRILGEEGLAVDESILTGESLPVEKAQAPVPSETPLAERISMVFGGTWVVRGRARAVVTAIGEATEEGRVVSLTERAKPPRTPLQRRLGGLTRVMVAAGAVVTLVIAAGLALRGGSADEAFLVGVSVAVAAVPEGLAATVTIALALGARAMAARGAIVRRLAAVETLGETTVICTDKTGTLTENRLHLAAAVPDGGRSLPDLLAAGVLASSAELVDELEELRIVGDPLEGALLLAARDEGITREALLAERSLVTEMPFDPARRWMASLYQEDGVRRLLVKGAPEALLPRTCVGADERRAIEGRVASLAREGSRVLMVCERRLSGPRREDEELERELRPLGLLAFHDPLRAGAPAAVREARGAGIEVVMVTGDHPVTARAIGRALDLADEEIVARADPSEKLELVSRLQERGDVVAVTGDGINDAPALRRADVGVAMGRSGTEAAREASALVLTDDNFATIVAAVREGRRISDNVRKFVAFLLSANLGEVFLFGAAVLGGLGVPMTVVQVLVVNVLTDGLPAVALSLDPVSPETMARPPRPGGTLFARRTWLGLAAIGALVGACALGAFLAGKALDEDSAQTMAFATVALAELVLVFALRSARRAAWRVPGNRWLMWAVAGSVALLVLAVYAGPLHEALGTTSLDLSESAVVLGLALLPALAVELWKQRRLRAGRGSGQPLEPTPRPPRNR